MVVARDVIRGNDSNNNNDSNEGVRAAEIDTALSVRAPVGGEHCRRRSDPLEQQLSVCLAER